MEPVKLSDNIYWVGAVDWDVRNFHGYLTQRGTTYNAYLVMDEKITLIDSVKPGKQAEMLSRISRIVSPENIDCVIANHVEMDHSGAITDIIRANPGVEVIASPKGVDGLVRHYGPEANYRAVKSGETLRLGKQSLEFQLTPMVHWPDNMVAYMPEAKTLFSNDAFGQHLASPQRFDGQYSLDIALAEAKKYYANILMPYSGQVKKALAAISHYDIETIACSHGIIWRKHVGAILEKYRHWAAGKAGRKAIIAYDSMWHSTEKMAGAVQEAFEEKNYAVVMHNLKHNHISDIVTDFLDTAYLCVGSPTLNKNIMPSVAAFLTYVKGLSPGGKKAVAFGSYGWASQSVSQIEEYMRKSKLELAAVFKVQYVPSAGFLADMKAELVRKIDQGITPTRN